MLGEVCFETVHIGQRGRTVRTASRRSDLTVSEFMLGQNRRRRENFIAYQTLVFTAGVVRNFHVILKFIPVGMGINVWVSKLALSEEFTLITLIGSLRYNRHTAN